MPACSQLSRPTGIAGSSRSSDVIKSGRSGVKDAGDHLLLGSREKYSIKWVQESWRGRTGQIPLPGVSSVLWESPSERGIEVRQGTGSNKGRGKLWEPQHSRRVLPSPTGKPAHRAKTRFSNGINLSFLFPP